jgi:thioredoxin reductase (NADPH)
MADAKPVLLAVDDDAEVLLAVARDLRRRYGGDYRVVRAGSGQEALDVLRTLAERDEPVALVLSDHQMPGMNGVRFLADAAALVPRAKRALLTAYADTDAAIAAINDSRVDYFLLKPWDPPEERLYPVLDDLLDDWRAGYRPGFGGLRIVGDRWSAEGHGLRDFLARNQVPYTFHDVERDEGAKKLLGEPPPERLPLVILEDGTRLVAPGLAEVAARVGMSRDAGAVFYDLAIVGGGPAGLASAVYGASEGLRTVLVEREAPGGQAGTSSRIENYLGFPTGLSGGDLARRAVMQARRFGVELLTPREVTGLRVDGPYRMLSFADGREFGCHALMLAMGVRWRKLPAEGAGRLTGRGIYYGAALSEAKACEGEKVYIIGAGNSAGQAAIYFADYADHVTMLVRGDRLGRSMSQYLVERIEQHEKIDVRTRHEVAACHGDERLEAVTLRDLAGGTEVRVPATSLFVFIGAAPDTGWLDGVVARDARGYVYTGLDLPEAALRDWPLERAPFHLEASVPGVFVAGDVRHESVKRVASAVGEGSVAVQFVHRHLAAL